MARNRRRRGIGGKCDRLWRQRPRQPRISTGERRPQPPHPAASLEIHLLGLAQAHTSSPGLARGRVFICDAGGEDAHVETAAFRCPVKSKPQQSRAKSENKYRKLKFEYRERNN